MTDRNRPITGPHFRPTANSHRCADYISNGSCRRPDEGRCVEWLKLKHCIEVPSRAAETKHLDLDAPAPSSASSVPADRDLFGNPIELPAPKPRLAPSASTSVATPHQPKPLPLVAPQGTAPVRAVTEANVTSFKACRIEACVDNDKLAPIWIVPEYTDESRHELKIEHAMVIAVAASVFPDARVTALRRPSNRPDEKSTWACRLDVPPSGVDSPLYGCESTQSSTRNRNSNTLERWNRFSIDTPGLAHAFVYVPPPIRKLRSNQGENSAIPHLPSPMGKPPDCHALLLEKSLSGAEQT